MKWSWRIARLAGIDVYVHATFLILLAWIGAAHYMQRHNWQDVVQGLFFIVTLFAIVVLHELGHALTARKFGIKTRDITLLPIGGVARLERMPEDPKQELLVALAGPAVNVVLALLCFGALIPLAGMSAVTEVENLALVGGEFLAKLVWVNVVLAVFNLIPAFPMDGGRVLRAFLAMRMDYVRATRTAAGVGQAMAMAFGLIGLLFGNVMLVFVALFVWMGAAGEANSVEIKASLGGVPVSHAMITDFHELHPHDPVSLAVGHILAGFQQDFPVVADGHVVGMLTRGNVMTALAQRGQEVSVEEVMQREFQTAAPSEMLDVVFARLQTCACRSVPVSSLGKLVGLINLENIGEYIMVQSALRGQTK